MGELDSLPVSNSREPITVLTAPVASDLINELMSILRVEKNLDCEIIICENHTFGNPVTVTGLLCGKDFREGIRRSQHKGPILIPPNSLNEEGRFLDDITPEDLHREFNRPVKAPNSFRDFFAAG